MKKFLPALVFVAPLVLGCPAPMEDKADPALPRFTIEVKGMT